MSKPTTSVRKSLTQKMMSMPQPNIVVSEPNALIPKTVQVIDEPVKTGAPISFVDVAKFNGKSKEKEVCGKKNGAAGKLQLPGPMSGIQTNEQIQELRSNATLLQPYMTSMFDAERIVYCRYGREYIPNIAKQSSYIHQ